MSLRHSPIRAMLVASLFFAASTTHAAILTLAFDTFLPSATDSLATSASLLGPEAIQTSTGNYQLPASSTLSGTIEIDLDAAPSDSATSPGTGIYESTTDFITVNYDTLLLPNPVSVDALIHSDAAEFSTERNGSASTDLFSYTDFMEADWLDTSSGLRYVLRLTSTIWVDTGIDGVLQNDSIDQPVSWTSDTNIAGEKTNFSLFYRLDTYDGLNLINRDEAQITTAQVTRVSAVPLPPAILLFGTGLLALVGSSRKMRNI